MRIISYIITFGFIVLDFISGMIKGVAGKKLSSTKMREGLFHKAALLLCMCLGVAIDVAQPYMNLGVTVPVGGAICVYITLMEIGSIIENVSEVNPQIAPDALRKIFGGNVDGGENHE